MHQLTRLIPLLLMALAGFLLFALELKQVGYVSLVSSLAVAAFVDHRMLRDLSLVAIGVGIVSLVPITTDISYAHMLQMGIAMIAAVGLPYLLSRYVYKDYTIQFPFRFKEPWGRAKWLYLGLVVLVGYFVMPLYLISTGMYVNWPAASDADSILRLFLGTNALGIWDELFFICIAFVVFSRYTSFWTANILQAVLFTSFLYELGFEGIGPIMIYAFALTQGYIFLKTHSLFYLLCIHLTFDFILFLVLLHAHSRELFPIFLY